MKASGVHFMVVGELIMLIVGIAVRLWRPKKLSA